MLMGGTTCIRFINSISMFSLVELKWGIIIAFKNIHKLLSELIKRKFISKLGMLRM